MGHGKDTLIKPFQINHTSSSHSCYDSSMIIKQTVTTINFRVHLTVFFLSICHIRLIEFYVALRSINNFTYPPLSAVFADVISTSSTVFGGCITPLK